MGLLDNLGFEPDPELKRVLLEIEAEQRLGVAIIDEETLEREAKLERNRRKSTNLGRVRMQRHLTQTDLASLSGVARRNISDFENGMRAPSVYTALALAQALEVSVEDLFHIKPPDIPRDDSSTDYWIPFSTERKWRRGR